MSDFPVTARGRIDDLRAAAACDPGRGVAFQGAPGCNGHAAALTQFPNCHPLPCFSFEDALDAVASGAAGRAVIPIENSLHGRVADVHFLLPESGLSIVGEYFHPIRHCLLGVGPITAVREVRSHPQALGQCRHTLRARGYRPVTHADTAAAAAEVAGLRDPAVAALAPPLAAELYGLEVLQSEMSDAAGNMTRFLTLSRGTPETDMAGADDWITTIIFRVHSVPAALYKALGSFATNGVNLTKIESYQRGGSFRATEFYCDIAGHPATVSVARALDELRFHSDSVRIIGVYTSALIRQP